MMTNWTDLIDTDPVMAAKTLLEDANRPQSDHDRDVYRLISNLAAVHAINKVVSDIRTAQDTAKACTDVKVKNEWIDVARKHLAALFDSPTTSETTDMTTNEWKQYKRKGLSEMRPWTHNDGNRESLINKGISCGPEDTPEVGGMVARNPQNHDDQWYVSKQYFEENLEPA